MDLYSAFIVVPHTQGAQVRITQCYLQITPYRTCLSYDSYGLTEVHKTHFAIVVLVITDACDLFFLLSTFAVLHRIEYSFL